MFDDDTLDGLGNADVSLFPEPILNTGFTWNVHNEYSIQRYNDQEYICAKAEAIHKETYYPFSNKKSEREKGEKAFNAFMQPRRHRIGKGSDAWKHPDIWESVWSHKAILTYIHNYGDLLLGAGSKALTHFYLEKKLFKSIDKTWYGIMSIDDFRREAAKAYYAMTIYNHFVAQKNKDLSVELGELCFWDEGIRTEIRRYTPLAVSERLIYTVSRNKDYIMGRWELKHPVTIEFASDPLLFNVTTKDNKILANYAVMKANGSKANSYPFRIAYNPHTLLQSFWMNLFLRMTRQAGVRQMFYEPEGRYITLERANQKHPKDSTTRNTGNARYSSYYNSTNKPIWEMYKQGLSIQDIKEKGYQEETIKNVIRGRMKKLKKESSQ